MAKAYKAKWIIPSDGNVYENCALVVEGGRITEIIKQENLDCNQYASIKDFGNSVITPGFVNLHNHLQYNGLDLPQKTNLGRKFRKLLTIIQKHYFLAGINKKSYIYRLANLLSD